MEGGVGKCVGSIVFFLPAKIFYGHPRDAINLGCCVQGRLSAIVADLCFYIYVYFSY